MKPLLFSALLVAGAFLSFSANAQTEAQMEAWQKYMEPGDMHKMMASWDGEWDEEVTHWMQPGAEPTKSKASCVNKMSMGGRYSESRHTGNFFGMPFEGYSLLAYDNAKKVFVNTWIDNLGTGVMILEGAWDQASKTITLKGKATDPMTGSDMMVRQTLRIVDDNTQVTEMFTEMEGKEFKNMEIVLKRKK